MTITRLMMCEGMFLFAKLVTLNLYEQTSRKSLLEEIQERFPRDLKEAYAIETNIHIYALLMFLVKIRTNNGPNIGF
jgi:hypothetical protein